MPLLSSLPPPLFFMCMCVCVLSHLSPYIWPASCLTFLPSISFSLSPSSYLPTVRRKEKKRFSLSLTSSMFLSLLLKLVLSLFIPCMAKKNAFASAAACTHYRTHAKHGGMGLFQGSLLYAIFWAVGRILSAEAFSRMEDGGGQAGVAMALSVTCHLSCLSLHVGIILAGGGRVERWVLGVNSLSLSPLSVCAQCPACPHYHPHLFSTACHEALAFCRPSCCLLLSLSITQAWFLIGMQWQLSSSLFDIHA